MKTVHIFKLFVTAFLQQNNAPIKVKPRGRGVGLGVGIKDELVPRVYYLVWAFESKKLKKMPNPNYQSDPLP